MKRVSCVLLPMLPLQILLRNKPHWAGAPIAVVDDEGPNGRITHLNALAKKSRLRIGMRQTVARDLLPNLHTAVVSPEETADVSHELIASLQTFSPRVEATDHAGAFYVDPEGLRRLYGGYRNWATSIHRYLQARHWHNAVTVGFHRQRALAVAMTHNGVTIPKSADDERRQSDQTPLREFDLPGELCESLGALGIETLGEFLVLPASELHSRFGAKASALHDSFADDMQLPIQPHAFDDPASHLFPSRSARRRSKPFALRDQGRPAFAAPSGPSARRSHSISAAFTSFGARASSSRAHRARFTDVGFDVAARSHSSSPGWFGRGAHARCSRGSGASCQHRARTRRAGCAPWPSISSRHERCTSSARPNPRCLRRALGHEGSRARGAFARGFVPLGAHPAR